MKAVVFHKPKDVRVEDVDEPTLQHPRDAIVRVTSTCVCGSDLHIYNGLLPQLGRMVMGHEFVGIVEQVGDEATGLQPGERVLVPFPIADGTCWFCTHGYPTHCEHSNRNYGPQGGVMREKGSGIFGYTDLYGGHDGGQAQKVRVPYADYGPRKIPDGLRDEQVVLLTDVVPTAWWANEWAEVKEGDTVAVFGCGPVGLMAQRMAKQRGAAKVIGVDIEEDRLAFARRFAGSEVVNAKEDDPVEIIRGLTEGRGADACIDAVGMEAHRNLAQKVNALVHLQRGSMAVLLKCFDAVRRGGRVGVVGVYGTPFDNFPLGQLIDKGLKVQGGQALVHEVVDDLLAQTKEGRLRSDDLITHTLPLDEAPYAYSMFNGKEDGCVKVLLKP